jgi:hypothetical protein
VNSKISSTHGFLKHQNGGIFNGDHSEALGIHDEFMGSPNELIFDDHCQIRHQSSNKAFRIL